MAVAGYNVQLFVGGISTVFGAFPVTLISPGEYRISSPTVMALDPNASITVELMGSELDESEFTVDRNFAIVTLNTPVDASDLTVNGSFIPLAPLTDVKEFSLNVAITVQDSTTYSVASGNGGWRTMLPTLRTMTASIGGFENFSMLYADRLRNGDPLFLSVRSAVGGETYRGWFFVTSGTDTVPLEGLLEQGIELQNTQDTNLLFSRRTL